jgi:hypothetical protein
VEKKDEEVGLGSRLLKKDSNRFIEPLMCHWVYEREGQCAVQQPQPRFRATARLQAGAQRHSILIISFSSVPSCQGLSLQLQNNLHSEKHVA